MNSYRRKYFTTAGPENAGRTAAMRISLAFGAAAVMLGVSIAASIFDFSAILSVPGNFFVRSYGGLAFLIPVYLVYAAFLLADPRYRPDRIFILASLTLPFFTVALGCYVIREYDQLAANSAFVARTGKFGMGFLIFLITSAESILIILLRSVLFFPKEPLIFLYNLKNRKQKNAENEAAEPAILLPAPAAKAKNLNDVYTAAATGKGAGFPDNRTLLQAPVIIINKKTASAEETEIREPDVIEMPAPAGPDELQADFSEPDDLQAENAEQDDLTPAENAETVEDSDIERALAEAEEAAARHGSVKEEAKPAKQARKRRFPYSVPVEGILNQYPDGEYWIIDDATRSAAVTLKETLKEFNIQADVTGIKKGPVITMFEILPAPGVKLSRIVNLQDNIALRLAASSVRIVAPIPGKHAVGIEVPNAKRNIVSFREIIEGELHHDGKRPEIPLVLGKDITGEAQTIDLATMPHLLIAGATGSGKSVCVNSMILSVLYQKPPSECRFILIDPKIVELKLYNDIPHLLTPVITEPKKAFQALQYCLCEMERRYACLDSMGVRDIRSYNKRIKERDMAAEFMPYIIVVIDEFADLMATTGKELESTVARLAAMSRAIGIHLVLATQRPSIDVITGLIKANIPSRIAFMVASKMDSRIIIDMVGAEKLLGRGDMLYAGAVDPFPIRMQGAFISEEEVERVVDYVKSLGEPDYIDDEIFYDEEEDDNASLFTDGDDPLYEKALEIVFQQGKASASFIQRRLKIGYNRAARLVEEMEHHGVVGPSQGSKPRELLRGYSA